VQLKVTVVEFGGEPQLVFMASTDIKVGDELLFGGQHTWKKRRWCHEEKVLSAACEEICLSGESRMTQGSINLELSLHFPEQTLESIKCLRTNPAFRALVNDLQTPPSAGTEGAESAVTAENLVGQDALPHDGEGGQPSRPRKPP